MLVDAISFEIRDFTTGTFEEFLVPDTADNFALIAGHRFTRQIQFVKKFDFQYNHEHKAPAFMIESLFTQFMNAHSTEFELDTVDEMYGVI